MIQYDKTIGDMFMKKIRTLLVALAVIALLVVGVTVIASADDTVITVNGTAYTADTIPTEIPDGASVVLYGACTIPYNANASYAANQAKEIIEANKVSLGLVRDGVMTVYGGLNESAAAKDVDIQDGDKAFVYYICTDLEYNANAEYVVCYGSFNFAHIRPSTNKITINRNSSVPGLGNDNILIGLGGTYFNPNTYNSAATYVVGEYANVKLADPSYCATVLMAIDPVNRSAGFGKSNASFVFTENTVVHKICHPGADS